MKIDVLSIGSFPEATNTELAQRFAVTHHVQQPLPQALNAQLKTVSAASPPRPIAALTAR